MFYIHRILNKIKKKKKKSSIRTTLYMWSGWLLRHTKWLTRFCISWRRMVFQLRSKHNGIHFYAYKIACFFMMYLWGVLEFWRCCPRCSSGYGQVRQSSYKVWSKNLPFVQGCPWPPCEWSMAVGLAFRICLCISTFAQ